MKNRPKIIRNGVLGGPGARFCSKLVRKVVLVTVPRCHSPIWMVWGVILGPQNDPKIDEKQLFVVTFCRLRFFSMFSCIFDPSRPIFVDSWSCGEPFGYVKHRSKCTLAFSDIFATFCEFSSISSRFLTILTSFLAPKSPKITKNGGSESRSKIDHSKRGPQNVRHALTGTLSGRKVPGKGGGM